MKKNIFSFIIAIVIPVLVFGENYVSYEIQDIDHTANQIILDNGTVWQFFPQTSRRHPNFNILEEQWQPGQIITFKRDDDRTLMEGRNIVNEDVKQHYGKYYEILVHFVAEGNGDLVIKSFIPNQNYMELSDGSIWKLGNSRDPNGNWLRAKDCGWKKGDEIMVVRNKIKGNWFIDDTPPLLYNTTLNTIGTADLK